MLIPNKNDAIHKAWLYRLLSSIVDDTFLVSELRFKGGTYAAMRGLLDRFSVDLDFDLLNPDQIPSVQKHLESCFKNLGMEIKDQSKKAPQYFLRYKSKPRERNTLKVDVTFPPPKSNDYEPVRLADIDRIVHCQTIPTMFANKLATIMDRYQKQGSLAGRDIYDIHTFFLKGLSYKPEIIFERTGKKVVPFLKELRGFIKEKFTQSVIDQDLGSLLPQKQFNALRKTLLQEVLTALKDELARL